MRESKRALLSFMLAVAACVGSQEEEVNTVEQALATATGKFGGGIVVSVGDLACNIHNDHLLNPPKPGINTTDDFCVDRYGMPSKWDGSCPARSGPNRGLQPGDADFCRYYCCYPDGSPSECTDLCASQDKQHYDQSHFYCRGSTRCDYPGESLCSYVPPGGESFDTTNFNGTTTIRKVRRVENRIWGPDVGSGSGSGSGAPACDGRICQTDRWEYLISQYDVAGTCGAGEHTGIGLRHTWNGCEVTYLMHNHGRTMHADFMKRKKLDDKALTLSHPFSVTEVYTREDRSQCIEESAAVDGFCDRLAGNDAYTLPARGLEGSPGVPQGGTWQVPNMYTSRYAYSYVDGEKDDVLDDQHRSLMGNVAAAGSWFCQANVPWLDYPHYGHNSNNDANAQLAAFKHCVIPTNASKGPSSAVLAVSLLCDGINTYPGGTSTNNIATPTTNHCSGCMNLPDNEPGITGLRPEIQPWPGSIIEGRWQPRAGIEHDLDRIYGM